METTQRDEVSAAFDDEFTVSGTYPPNPSSAPHILHHYFSPLDFCVFTAMLLFSALIGVYFAFFAKQKQNTTSEYLMGGKNMGITPVSMSLISSYISGITLLGMSAEMYTYGTQYCTTLIGLFIAVIICGIFFMPVFYKLQLNTSYEYLEIRFDRRVRLLGSFLFIISSMLYIPIVIYVPALAFSQITGVNLHMITPLVCLVCIFYTSLGGLKAVVWTDALQTVVMFGAMFAVVLIGTSAVGGVDVVWERNERSGRVEFFNLDPDPTLRHTFWNTAFGSAFTWATHCSVNQSMVQRFLAMSNIKRAQIMIVAFTVGVFIITAVSFYAGMLIFASYYDCDLISTKVVRAPEQLLPYFVMDVANSLPGLPGLFMAGIFSAALSSMSTGLNSMSGVIYEDFIHPYLKYTASEEQSSFIMKIICVVIGAICVGIVFVIEHLGAVLQVSGSLRGVTSGPMMALFVLGMFFPWSNSKGALTGGIAGLLVMGYISFGTHAAVASGQIKFEKKPVSLEGCTPSTQSVFTTLDAEINATTLFLSTVTEETPMSEEGPLPIFLISYILYTLLGLTFSVVVGLVASAATGLTDPADVRIELLTPPIRPFFARRCKREDVTEDWKSSEKVGVFREKDESIILLKKLPDTKTERKRT